MEAELAYSPETRRPPLLKALFLDPLSPRLKLIPAVELSQAKEELGSRNPFLQPRKRVIRGPATASVGGAVSGRTS